MNFITVGFDAITSSGRRLFSNERRRTDRNSYTPQQQRHLARRTVDPQQPYVRRYEQPEQPEHTVKHNIGRFGHIVFGILVILMLIGGVAGGISWKQMSDEMQNYATIMQNGQAMHLKIKQSHDVIVGTTVTVTFTDGNNKLQTVTYRRLPVDSTFIIKGEVLHLVGSSARFRLVAITPSSNNNALPSSDLGSWWTASILTLSHCSVTMGPVTDTLTHDYTLLVLPDDSCSLQNN